MLDAVSQFSPIHVRGLDLSYQQGRYDVSNSKEKPKVFYLESKDHMVSKDSLSAKEAKTIVALGETIPIQTANGEVELTEKVNIYVQDLKTVGTLVAQHCCSFVFRFAG